MAARRRHWKEKGGRFWACLSIPVVLRPMFGKTQLTEPLGGDLRLADRNHAAAVARLQAMLDAARGQIGQAIQGKPLTKDDQEELIWKHYQTELQRIEAKRAAMPTPAQIDAEYELAMQRLEAGDASLTYAADYELAAGARYFDRNLRVKRLAALRAAIPSGETKMIDAAVSHYVTEHGIDVANGSPEWRALAGALIRAEIEALERSVEFDRGEVRGGHQRFFGEAPCKRGGQDQAWEALRGLHCQPAGSRPAQGRREELARLD